MSIVLMAALAMAEITLENEAVEGQPNVVVLTDINGRPRGGETVRVVHRPGLSGEREVAIGITDGLGRVRWTPDLAGISRVRAGDETLDLRVGWPSLPLDVVVLLGLLLVAGLGATGYGVRGLPTRRA